MKPQMLFKMKISINPLTGVEFTEEEINLEFANDNIKIEEKKVIRKSDDVIIGEVLI